jgi:Tfp pilus assembly protein PilV
MAADARTCVRASCFWACLQTRQGGCFIDGMAPARGFALLDALLASTVLIVCVLSLVQLFVLAARADRTARHLTIGSILAAQKVEELRSTPWSTRGEGVDRIGEFTRRWTVTPLAVDPANTAVIDVRVAPGGIALVTLRTSEDDP